MDAERELPRGKESRCDKDQAKSSALSLFCAETAERADFFSAGGP
jgi:hypothetical protein